MPGIDRHRRTAARVRTTIAVLVAAAAAVACAPDSVRNVDATGFDAYLAKLPDVCNPFIIGSQDVGQMIQYNDVMDTNYIYFTDNASRLYYNRVGQGAFQQAIVSFFGDGSYNAASFSCMFSNLPGNRPNAP